MRIHAAVTSPRLWMVGLTAILVTAALLGLFWIAVAAISLAFVFIFAKLSPDAAGAVAFTSLLLGHVLMAVESFHPAQNNYWAYSVAFASIVGMAQMSKSDWIPLPPMLFLILLTISAAYSTVSLNPTVAYALIIAPLALVAGYLVGRHSSSWLRRYVLRVLLWFAVGESLLGISQTIFRTAPFAALAGEALSGQRNYLALLVPSLSMQVRMATGTFEQFNGLGSVLALCMPLALWRWLERRSLGNLLVALVVGAGIVCTFSRGSLLGAVLGCSLLVFANSPRDERRVIRASLGALVTLAAITLAFTSIAAYIRATNNAGSRIDAWLLSLGATVSDPARLLFGAGFGFYASGFLVARGAISRLHSMPVQVFVELGIPGFVLACLAFAPPIRRGFFGGEGLETALAASCLTFLASQLFDNAYFGFTGALFMIVFGLLVARLQLKSADGPATMPRMPRDRH